MKDSSYLVKLALFLIAVISTGLLATFPISNTYAATPAEMIQSGLPPTTTLQSAPKKDFLMAVCNAVDQHRNITPKIVRLAIETRPEFSRDVITTAIGCLREPKEGAVDCDLARRILVEAIAANPGAAYDTTEVMLNLLPDCQLDIPAEGPNVPIGIPPGPILGPGPSFCVICHNGQEIHVPCERTENYLVNHPGDTRGACQSTPVTNP